MKLLLIVIGVFFVLNAHAAVPETMLQCDDRLKADLQGQDEAIRDAALTRLLDVNFTLVQIGQRLMANALAVQLVPAETREEHIAQESKLAAYRDILVSVQRRVVALLPCTEIAQKIQDQMKAKRF